MPPTFGFSRARGDARWQISLQAALLALAGLKLVLSHPSSPRLRGPRWQAHPVGEDVLIMGDAIQRERIEVARIRPDGMRLRSYLQDQSAVVAVEPGLDAVRGWEDGRDHLEVERRVQPRSAGQDIVGVFGSHAVLTGWGRCDGIRK